MNKSIEIIEKVLSDAEKHEDVEYFVQLLFQLSKNDESGT